MILLVAALAFDSCESPAEVAARLRSLPDRDVRRAYAETVEVFAE